MLFVPAFQVLIICLAIGNDPKPMKFGVVNYEVENATECLNPKPTPEGCDVEELSCKFLWLIPQDTIPLVRLLCNVKILGIWS